MNTRLSTPSLPNRHAHSQDNARPEIHAHTKKRSTCKHNSLSQQCQSAVSFIGVPGYYTTWINSSYSFLISTIRTVSHNFSVLYLLHMSSAFKVGEKKLKKSKKKNKTWHMSEEKNQSLWTSCICQIYGITLYRAAWADESSSRPAGFQIHLSAQTFCFLPHMCCALKQTRQKVCNVKSVFAQVC